MLVIDKCSIWQLYSDAVDTVFQLKNFTLNTNPNLNPNYNLYPNHNPSPILTLTLKTSNRWTRRYSLYWQSVIESLWAHLFEACTFENNLTNNTKPQNLTWNWRSNFKMLWVWQDDSINGRVVGVEPPLPSQSNVYFWMLSAYLDQRLGNILTRNILSWN